MEKENLTDIENKAVELLDQEFETKRKYIDNLIRLFDEGATIPFIARYRKEMTGSMDEVTIRNIESRYHYFKELEERKQKILSTIENKGLLTPLLKKSIEDCRVKQELEDLYLPFRPKKKSKAKDARKAGLEPLAKKILTEQDQIDLKSEAEKYVSEEKGTPDVNKALERAGYIIAEWMSENAEVRRFLRELFYKDGAVVSEAVEEKKEAGKKFKDYFDYNEPLESIPSHRYLAIRRGCREGFLKMHLSVPHEKSMDYMEEVFLTTADPDVGSYLLGIIKDSYKRLILPQIELDVRTKLKERADCEAIKVFSENLRKLLLSPHAGGIRVVGIDPGLRTGCKLSAVDETGRYLSHTIIYPHSGQEKEIEAMKEFTKFIGVYQPEALVMGNGTGSRETDIFIKKAYGESSGPKPPVVTVNEAGASVYSVSAVSREELPDLDAGIRGAVSIARRFQDPLAELVKIDPKSIGVGQYQHDVNQRRLKKSLDSVVESCVNYVGVELNTASKCLLSYVSGLSDSIAASIVDFRNTNGKFINRSQLINVQGLGPKTFQLAAGFLRIREAENPLDNTGIHPESYEIVNDICKVTNSTVTELLANNKLINELDLKRFVTEKTGMPTIRDIAQELKKPGRDPRKNFKIPEYRADLMDIDDLKAGMILEGRITNVTNFGVFVDLGVHQDGMVHISEMAHEFVKNPQNIASVGDVVKVKILEVKPELKRISLSMKSLTRPKPSKKQQRKPRKPRKPSPHDPASTKDLTKLKKFFNRN